MGCATALHLARGGMRVALVERNGLCAEASGRNAGTTMTPMFSAPFLVPYALRGMELWKSASSWIGHDIDFQVRGGLELAFSETEATGLESAMGERVGAGAPIEIMDLEKALRIEPEVSPKARLAAYCSIDGFVATNASGRAFRVALLGGGVRVMEGTPVISIERWASASLSVPRPGASKSDALSSPGARGSLRWPPGWGSICRSRVASNKWA